MGVRVDWSDLPTELLPAIVKSLDTRIDVLRFRSVCSSWRSSVPPFHANSPRFPLKFPNPSTLTGPPPLPIPPAFLCQSSLYYIQPLNPSTSSSSNKWWLMKVEESDSGKLHLVDPLLTTGLIRYSVHTPKTLNLLNFRMVEFAKAYMLRYPILTGPKNETTYVPWFMLNPHFRPNLRVKKVLVFPNSSWTNADECSFFVLFDSGKLGFAKCGDEKLTDINGSCYNDIIVYKGQFYAINSLGTVWRFEYSSLKLVRFSHPLVGVGRQKYLVESCGALYVVDGLYRKDKRLRDNRYPKIVGFEVFKLDEEWGEWDLVRSLGDQAFVLGTDCSFSVSAPDVFGCKGDRIHFIDAYVSRVFNLKDQSINDIVSSSDHSDRFWPPPS
ncbi:putative F-box protein At1g65770 isoform X1 [Alnus glutinosa]|uniref:putative F-box protein At1g65770 isoform X1 n=1 Tax=Alnus glutinosa TaxID=3517 RepID=UPI002D76D16B|nr:putative F-box protein At1g65770 isoform X1 [Alnus glutinosa]